MSNFDIPIVLFLFKRADKSALIIDRIARISPKKIYLIADGPRFVEEQESVALCRRTVEEHITWDCDIVKNYSNINRGVYENIAGGAKWVFETEKKAIFLEDDNLPDLSFFSYCHELLNLYENDTRILWICGTNYLRATELFDGSDYFFSKLMLPCGWASWSDKFIKFYDGELSLLRDSTIKGVIKNEYKNKLLFKHDYDKWMQVLNDIDVGKQPNSWDYQMAFTLRANNLFGIVPRNNLIRNIGADIDSIHGGVSIDNVMTNRFCEIPTSSLYPPLKHPKSLMTDPLIENLMEKIIILPLKYRLKGKFNRLLKRILRIKQDDSLTRVFKQKYLSKLKMH